MTSARKSSRKRRTSPRKSRKSPELPQTPNPEKVVQIDRSVIIIPSGRPDVALTPSRKAEAAAEITPASPTPDSPDIANSLLNSMEQGLSSGLSDSSSALADALGHQTKKTPARIPSRSSPSSSGGSEACFEKGANYRPEDFSDEDLIAWATANRKQHRHGYLALSALQYWLGYTFHSYTPEYRELSSRLAALFPVASPDRNEDEGRTK